MDPATRPRLFYQPIPLIMVAAEDGPGRARVIGNVQAIYEIDGSVRFSIVDEWLAWFALGIDW